MAMLLPNPTRTASYHFHIASPKYDDCFDDQLLLSIKKLSTKTLCVDDHRLDTAEGSTVVLVRLKLSTHGQLLSLTLDAAIKGLCGAMVVSHNKCTVETLTSRSLGGIVPISEIFNTHWTVAIFNEALSHGPDMASFLSELQNEARANYLLPTVAALCFAVFAGIGSCFSFLATSGPLSNPATIDALCSVAFAGVANYMEDFVDANQSTVSLPQKEAQWKLALTQFQNKFDDVLKALPTPQVPVVEPESAEALVLFQPSTRSPRADTSYELCDNLCKLTVAAAKLLTLRKPLFDLIRQQRTNDLAACTAHTVASGAMLWSLGGAIALGLEVVGETALIAEGALSASACAAAMVCWPVALVAGGLAIKNGVMAVRKYQDKTASDRKKNEYYKVSQVVLASWDTAFQMRLFIEWIRVGNGADPSDFKFTDPESQRKWDTWVAKYREVTGQGPASGQSNANEVKITIEEMGRRLGNYRQLLD